VVLDTDAFAAGVLRYELTDPNGVSCQLEVVTSTHGVVRPALQASAAFSRNLFTFAHVLQRVSREELVIKGEAFLPVSGAFLAPVKAEVGDLKTTPEFLAAPPAGPESHTPTYSGRVADKELPDEAAGSTEAAPDASSSSSSSTRPHPGPAPALKTPGTLSTLVDIRQAVEEAQQARRALDRSARTFAVSISAHARRGPGESSGIHPTAVRVIKRNCTQFLEEIQSTGVRIREARAVLSHANLALRGNRELLDLEDLVKGMEDALETNAGWLDMTLRLFMDPTR
jgi:hypothetical protein